MASFAERDILLLLDRSEFPTLGNMNIDYVSGRLLCFRSESQWALVFNWIVWWPAVEGPHAMVECFGNGINGKQGFDNDRLFSPVVFEEDWEDDEADEPTILSIEIRGQSIALEQVPSLPHDSQHQDAGFGVLAGLATQHKAAMLASEAEYMPFIAPDLDLVLTLDDWHHPDVLAKPSECKTFQQLARVLVTGDSSLYEPTQAPNTYWENWILK